MLIQFWVLRSYRPVNGGGNEPSINTWFSHCSKFSYHMIYNDLALLILWYKFQPLHIKSGCYAL